MPYTIHLAETEDEARDSLADLSIDYQVHRQIFEGEEASLHDLPLFYHLSDFYQDAVFIDSHVLSLRVEVEQARARIHDPRATETLSALGKICERAIKKRLNIFGFGE